MTKKKGKNKNSVTLKEFYTNQIGLLAQAILTLFVIVFAIASIFEPRLATIMQILLSLVLLVMAYNNEKQFKRSNFTLIYLLGAIISMYFAISN